MRSYIINLTEKYSFIKILTNILLKFRNNLIPLKLRLKRRFKRLLGYDLNLKDPKTFNEKIQWLKLNDRSKLHVICSDKLAVREYIKEKIGEKYLVPLIFSTTDIMDLKPENLPDYPAIIKANHDSSGGVFIWNKHEINWVKLRAQFKSRLKSVYGIDKGEWQYSHISPCIIAEKILITEDGGIPSDYKLHCFNGKLVFTDLHFDRFSDHKRNLYDINWNLIDCRWVYENGPEVKKPEVYPEMKAIAEKLAKDFIYVRVDLYVIGKVIYFGELTFHAGSGNEIFIPSSWDRKFGQLLQLPI